ncbi:MAG TPA: T9SS type A sorting domain-containing protein [bacterium]|nr:T9SS type A sorting domain-containing protein [bacterium]
MNRYSFIVRVFVALVCFWLHPFAAADDGKKRLETPTITSAVNWENSHRRTGIHDGNRIRSAFSNFGNLGSRTLTLRGEWPKASGVNYMFESAFYVGAEVTDANNHVIHIFTDSYTGAPRDWCPADSHTYSWEPLPGFFNQDPTNIDRFPAMSHLPHTWPVLWPNRPPEWAGKWIGEAGPWPMADQESYYLMDDRNNDEFAYYPFVASHLDSMPWPDGRRGLGLEVQVRTCQWNDPRLQDAWFAIYDIKNVSHKDLLRVVCGFYHDWDIGTERNQSDAGDDALSFNAPDGLVYQWDLNGRSAFNKPTGWVGQKILQAPDHLGLTSFWGTSSGDVISDDEEAWQIKTQPGTFVPGGELDAAFITGSGYFGLLRGESKRYAMVIVMGEDFATLRHNSRMAQWFYDGGYSFAVHRAELLSPAGGETVQGAVEIKWKTNSAAGPLLVDIFYTIDDWKTWHTIAMDEEDDGVYSWDTNAVDDGINYSIRVIAHNALGMGQSPSSARLTINNPTAAVPEVIILSPASGQAISGRHDIRWRAGDADGDAVILNLFYSPDSGRIWHSLVENETNDGIYSWDTSSLANGNKYLLKAVVSDGDLEGAHILTGPFRIANDHPPMKPTYIEHLAGSSNAAVGVHVIDPSALTDHTFELTFSSADGITTYHVYDLNAESYVLQDEPLHPDREGAIFLGVRLWLHDFPEPAPLDSLTGWITGDANLMPVVDKDPGEGFIALPADFQIRILGANADTSYSPVTRYRIPVNFQIWNVTDSVQMEFLFAEHGVPDGQLSEGDIITLIANRIGRKYNLSWRIQFLKPILQKVVLPESGDVAFIAMAKPFAATDVYRFQTLPDYFTAVQDKTQPVASFSLQQNYPNPFNAATTIEYHLSTAGVITLQIFDMLGREVATLVDGHQREGLHRIGWNGLDKAHQPAANGIYVYRITAENRVAIKKMVLLK